MEGEHRRDIACGEDVGLRDLQVRGKMKRVRAEERLKSSAHSIVRTSARLFVLRTGPESWT